MREQTQMIGYYKPQVLRNLLYLGNGLFKVKDLNVRDVSGGNNI